jgi:hypothetical protein
MAMTVQVTFDCESPHTLAAWWAEVLQWSVEAQDAAFIRQMVEAGFASEDETMVFEGKLVWRTGAAISAPEGVAAPRILFQHVPEGKTAKNRVHLDLRTGVEDVEAARARVAGLGAIAIGGGQQGPHSWVTYVDPEGNEFCL